jgi:hypothetical protein
LREPAQWDAAQERGHERVRVELGGVDQGLQGRCIPLPLGNQPRPANSTR